jgi:DNA-binding PadR family transcriptional regulator
MGRSANPSRLLVLWLLSKGPRHGYEIKKTLDDPGLRFWFPIEFGSIYSVLRFLKTKAYAKRVAVERAGRRPERTRYAITPLGRRYFADLLREAWRWPVRMTQPVDVALAALTNLALDDVRTLAAERRAALLDRLQYLDRSDQSAPSPELVERARAFTAAELRWLDGYIDRGFRGEPARRIERDRRF